MTEVVLLLLAYLLGSIPSAYLAGKWGKGIDLRKVGSGNLGFTNALRALGVKWSVPVLLFDVLKGYVAVWLAQTYSPGHELFVIVCGLVAILGHNWTIFLGFKGGGKGVAASAGVFFALTPICFAIALAAFLVILITTRYMSLASMTLGITLAGAGTCFRWAGSDLAPSIEVYIFSVIAAVLIVIRHQSNIKRLMTGTEKKFGAKEEENQQ